MEDNKKKIINILCAIIVLCIVGLLASIVIKVINKNKENQIKEESTEFFDDYLYTFNSSFGKKSDILKILMKKIILNLPYYIIIKI